MFGKLIPIVTLPILFLVAQQPEIPPNFKGQSQLVVVSAIVRDKHGNHVSGLIKDDFTILEGGKRQEIKIFEELQTTAGALSVSAPSTPQRIHQSGYAGNDAASANNHCLRSTLHADLETDRRTQSFMGFPGRGGELHGTDRRLQYRFSRS